MVELAATNISCGIDEVFNLKGSVESLIKDLKYKIDLTGKSNHVRLILACITDNQKTAKKALQKVGFKLSKRFINANSGNWNNLYIYLNPKTSQVKLNSYLDYDQDDEEDF